jgi:hypothetical protein
MARAKDKVIIGYCHPADVSAGFNDSMLNLHVFDRAPDGPWRVVGRLGRYSSANVSNARNWIVKTFLEKSSADWLLMLDADMTFEPTLVEDLLANASIDRAPVVGGLCFGVDEGTLFPTLYGVAAGFEDEAGVHTIRFDEYPRDSMFQVAATGAACLLMHRTVLERVRDAEHAKGNHAYEWFMESVFNGHPCGEDVTFCHRVNALGIPVFVDTGVTLGHVKTYVLTETMYREQRAQLRPPASAVPPASGADPQPEETV